MSDYYATLLTSEFTLFGILIAVVFFYIQQVSSQFTYRATRSIMRDWRLWVFVISAGLAIGMTALALGSIFVSGLKATPLGQIVQNDGYATLALLLVVVSALFFFILLYQYVRYMDSSALVKNVVAQIQASEVKDYLHHRYGIPEPIGWRVTISTRVVGTEGAEIQPETQIVSQDDALLEGAEKEFKRLDSRLKKRFKDKPPIDPFSPLIDIAINAIIRHDLDTWRAAISQITELIEVWVDKGEFTPKAKSIGKWNPESSLALNLTKSLTEYYRFLLETLHDNGHSSLELDVLDSAAKVSIAFAQTRQQWPAVFTLLEFWGEVGPQGVYNQRRRATIRVAETLGEIGRIAAGGRYQKSNSETAETHREIFDEVCRLLGNLGERVLLRGIEIEPVMPTLGTKEGNELDAIVNALDTLKDILLRQTKPFYALIYIDAIEVITDRILEAPNNIPNPDNTLIALWSGVRDIAVDAAKCGDENNLGLCSMRLRLAYEKVSGTSIEWNDLPKYIVRCLAEIGIKAAYNNKPLEEWTFQASKEAGFDYVGLVIKQLQNIPLEDLNPVMFDVFLHSIGEHEGAWEFITRTAKMVESNFGLRFDWQTGERYPSEE